MSPVLKLNEAPMHPHNKERNSFVTINDDSSDKKKTTHLPNMSWLNLNDKTLDRKFRMPLFGQRTESILKELNYTSAEIERLVNERIVAVSPSNNKQKPLNSKL